LWRAAVLAKRQEILEESSNIYQQIPVQVINHKPNEVKLVNKKYIDCMFKPTTEADDVIIESSVANLI